MDEFLSDLERNVLNAYLDGKSYQEIALELNRHVSLLTMRFRESNGSWSVI